MSDNAPQCLKRRRSDLRLALVKEAEKWVQKLVDAESLPPGEEYGSIAECLREMLKPIIAFAEKADRATANARFTDILKELRITYGLVEVTRSWAHALRQKEQR